jgi:hypothetical protein
LNAIKKTLITLLVCASASAAAAEPANTNAAKAQYDAERARCMSGTTGQDQASCLRSAGAAYDAIRGNRLQDANTTYDANAMARCSNLPSSDRMDCEARVKGEGTTSGSVKAGGTITETVTPLPATKR